MRASKITARGIINALAKSDFVFRLNRIGEIRAKEKHKNYCHCPISAFIELKFGDSYRAIDISASSVSRDYGLSYFELSTLIDAADYREGSLMSYYEVKIRQYMLKKFGLEDGKKKTKVAN